MSIVMGSAGHIDHGKTSLVELLTGTNCDRLDEEKKRGITIDIGFAFCDLPNNSRIGIVDVPGHERFVKNMVAGASGIDFVMLVIAADEGVMPQTKEHLEICSLLGIRTGFVALTKVDLVDEEWLNLAIDDVQNFLKGSFLEQSNIISVSSVSKQGLTEVLQEIECIEKNLNPKLSADIFRLPVDRVFTLKGYGTVITGTSISGKLKVNDEVILMPKEKQSKVRSLQSHGQSAELAPAGQRTAVNLTGIEVAEITRGDVLCHPNSLKNSPHWLIELTCLSSSPRPLRHKTEVHFHHGSKEIPARLHLIGKEKLNPGEKCLCAVKFASNMVGVASDPCVIRTFSPLRTVAGAKIINPLGFELRQKSIYYLRQLAIFNQISILLSSQKEEDIQTLLLLLTELYQEQGLYFSDFILLSNLENKILDKNLSFLCSKQLLILIDKENKLYLNADSIHKLMRSCREFLATFHQKEPTKNGLGRSALSSSWGRQLNPKLIHYIQEKLLKQNILKIENDLLSLSEHQATFKHDELDLKEQILNTLSKSNICPPSISELTTDLKINPKQTGPLLKALVNEEKIVKVNEDFYFVTPAIVQVKELILNWFKNNSEISPADLRDLTGLSRKYCIPLLEYLDQKKITMRVGDKRVLRRG